MSRAPHRPSRCRRRSLGQSATETLVVLVVFAIVFFAGRPNVVTQLIQALHRLRSEFLLLIALP